MPVPLLGRRNVALVAAIACALLPLVANPYILYVANIGLIYVLLAVGLNLLVGYAGQLSFGNAALFGIGAYGTGLLQIHLGLPYWAALPGGAVLATLVGTLIAFPALRLNSLYLALATLAFAQFTQWVFLNWEPVTFGAGGFRLPPPDFAPLPVPSTFGVYYLTFVLALILVWLADNMTRSRLGRALVAIRDGEVAAEGLGVDLLRYKALAFALSAFYAGLAGGLFSAVLNFVAPEGYDLFQMITQKAMIVVGGLGSVAGSVIGAFLLTAMQESLRSFKGLQEVAFGAVLLVFVLFMPGGVVAMLKRHVPGWEEKLRHPGEAEAAPRGAPAVAPAEKRP